jgi:hypothetical protein
LHDAVAIHRNSSGKLQPLGPSASYAQGTVA